MRYRGRYPLLEQLRDAGRIGETRDGEVALVKATHAGDPADPKDRARGTVGELVAAETLDRHVRYALLARELRRTAAEVAAQNGVRNVDKAKPEHWIRVQAEWVQRRSIKPVGPD